MSPTITTTTLPNGGIGMAYNQTLIATGTPSITWSMESGNLPTGLTLSENGVIAGIPTTAGMFNFTVKATNSVGFNTQALSITIDTPPIITTNTLPNGTKGTAYNQTFTATGTSPITWSRTSGDLPNGLILSTDGVISGTPLTGGTFNFTVKATNSVGFDTKDLSIVIVAPPVITTNVLPNGVIGTAYNQTLTADGDAPITWSMESGNLPNGLTLSLTGAISGTPTTAGTFNFTVKAINSIGNDTKALSIYIKDGVGISENKLSNITVYPNPTDGQLRITNYKLQNEDYRIFSVLGQMIMHGKLQEETTIINVAFLENGIYYLRVGDKTVKFVKA
jgi:hypothetical protein